VRGDGILPPVTSRFTWVLIVLAIVAVIALAPAGDARADGSDRTASDGVGIEGRYRDAR